MAIAFARLTIHSRSKGQSIVASAAYRSGTRLFDERIGETFDYSRRSDVAHAEILLPEGGASRFGEREYLWNQAEKAEKRKDAQVGKDLTLALPKELSLGHQIELVKRFAHEHFVNQGLVVDFAIHDKGDGNPHAHLLVSMRKLERKSFSLKKPRELNPIFYGKKENKQLFDPWNEKWREFQNQFFLEKHIDLTVDANYLLPTRHQGRIRSTAEEHYLKTENQLLKEASLEAAQTPESILEHLSHRYATFTLQELGSVILKNTNSKEAYDRLMQAVQSHSEFLFLGNDPLGKPRYTTRSLYRLEEQMISHAYLLSGKKEKSLYNRVVEKMAERFGLSAEQTEAVRYLTQAGDIACLVGRAGTGKTYTMKAIRELYEQKGYAVYGAAIAGIAAKTLRVEAGIESDTIYSLSKRIEQGRFTPKPHSVLVIDEAGMVPLQDMARILEFAKNNHNKVILLGDPDQLQPILAGAPFRALIQHLGFFEMKDIRRQRRASDREASRHAAEGRIGLTIDHYVHQKQLHFVEDGAQSVITAWEKTFLSLPKTLEAENKSIEAKSIKKNIILAFTKKQVAELNTLAHQSMKQHGQLSTEGKIIKTENGLIEISVGEKIVFLKNNYDLKVMNGEFGTVKKIEEDGITVSFSNNTVKFDPKAWTHFDYGYAMTVHKSQSATFDRVFTYIEGYGWNRFMSYVAMTRHKESLEVFAHEKTFSNLDDLKRKLSRAPIRDNPLDYPLTYAERRGFDPESVLGRLINQIAKVGSNIKDAWEYIEQHEAWARKQQFRKRHHLPEMLEKSEIKIEAKHSTIFEPTFEIKPEGKEEKKEPAIDIVLDPEWSTVNMEATPFLVLRDYLETGKRIHNAALKVGNPENTPEFLALMEDTLLTIKKSPKLWETFEKLMPKVSAEMNKRFEYAPDNHFELLLNPEWKTLDPTQITESWMLVNSLKLGKDIHETAWKFQNDPKKLKNLNKILEDVLLKAYESKTQQELFQKFMPKTAELFAKRKPKLALQKRLERAREMEYGYER